MEPGQDSAEKEKGQQDRVEDLGQHAEAQLSLGVGHRFRVGGGVEDSCDGLGGLVSVAADLAAVEFSQKEFSAETQEKEGGDGSRITLEPGRYVVSAFVMAFGGGNFIARLRVCCAGTTEPTLGEELAAAGTDSAAVGVCDADEMLVAYRAKFGDDRNAGALFLENFDFKRAGLLRVASETGPTLVYVQSGFGDGAGPVLELLDGQRRVGVELPFIETGTTI